MKTLGKCALSQETPQWQVNRRIAVTAKIFPTLSFNVFTEMCNLYNESTRTAPMIASVRIGEEQRLTREKEKLKKREEKK